MDQTIPLSPELDSRIRAPIFVVSDATGLTAERVIQAVLVQFDRYVDPVIHRYGHVRTTGELERILEDAEAGHGRGNHGGLSGYPAGGPNGFSKNGVSPSRGSRRLVFFKGISAVPHRPSWRAWINRACGQGLAHQPPTPAPQRMRSIHEGSRTLRPKHPLGVQGGHPPWIALIPIPNEFVLGPGASR